MNKSFSPPIWLIIFIIGLPQLSETVYTPSLPDISRALQTTDAMVEYTLTIYLFAFAIGTLFWGKISDKFGRKPCIIAGLVVYLIGCFGCYASSSITHLMICRFIQAFGGSIGSVLGQAVCRDAFSGSEIGKAYSLIGMAIALFSALGPVVGGFIAENFGWSNIFLFLIAFGFLIILMVIFYLEETRQLELYRPISIKQVTMQMIVDKKVIGCGLLVAGCNGINFSYFAEGPFYLIEILGLSPSEYGLTFVIEALVSVLGGIAVRKLLNYYSSQVIMEQGLKITLTGSAIFSIFILCSYIVPISNIILICITLTSRSIIILGMCMIIPNTLGTALTDYKWCVGTASAIFGFFYYIIISLITFGMGLLHNDTLIPMPLYFLAISVFMLRASKMIKQK